MIIRRKYTKNFCIMPGEVFEDRRLSLDALGLLSYLRSRPDDWSVSQAHLADLFRVGKDKMQRIMRELIETGWIERQTARAAGRGTFAGAEYVVNDKPSVNEADASPQPENQAAVEVGQPQPGLPALGQPEPGEPAPVNAAAYLESNLNQDSPPPNPPTGGGGHARELLRGNGVTVPPELRRAANRELPPVPALEGEVAERFARLEAAYPEAARGVTKPDQARAIFAAMSAEEQVLAIGAAGSYAATLERSGYAPKGLHGWLSQRRFLNFRPAMGSATGSAPIGATSAAETRVFVEHGTPEWEAWAADRRASGDPRPYPMVERAGHRNPGWFFPTAMPKPGRTQHGW